MQPLNEKDWQAQVRKMFLQFGWERELFYHTWSSMKSQRGFPDIVAGKTQGIGGAPRLLVAELKRNDGKLRPSQTLWMDLFNASTRAYGVRPIEVYVWRPYDVGEVAVILYGREAPPAGTWPTSWDVCREYEMANLAPEKQPLTTAIVHRKIMP